MKIRCRSRRTFSSCTAPVDGVPVEGSSSGPFTVIGVQLVLRFRGIRHSSSQAHLPTSAPFRAGHQARYPASYTDSRRRRSRSQLPRFPAAFRLPAFASWASCSRQGIPPLLTVGLPRAHTACRTLTGFPRSARMRYDRGGCPLYPGSGGVHTAVDDVPGRRLPLLSGRSLSPRPAHPTRGVAVTRHQQWFTGIHPSGLPLTCGPRTERGPLGFPPGFAPGRYRPRTPGRGPVLDTDPESRLRHQPNLQSTDSLTACDLVSQLIAAEADIARNATMYRHRAWLTTQATVGTTTRPIGRLQVIGYPRLFYR